MTWDENGNERSLGFYGKGDYLHSHVQISPFFLKAVTEVDLVAVPESDINYQAISNNLQMLVRLLQLRKVNDKVEGFLRWIAKYGYPKEDGRIELPALTHQQIADAIATTRVTVTRVLREMEEEGMICRKNRRLILQK